MDINKIADIIRSVDPDDEWYAFEVTRQLFSANYFTSFDTMAVALFIYESESLHGMKLSPSSLARALAEKFGVN